MQRSGLSKWVSVVIRLSVMPLAVTAARAASLPGNAAAVARSGTLPQCITAAELQRMLMDLPGTFEIVNVRLRKVRL